MTKSDGGTAETKDHWKVIVGVSTVVLAVAAVIALVVNMKSCSGEFSMEAKGEVHPFEYSPAFKAEAKLIYALATKDWPAPGDGYYPHGCWTENSKGKRIPCGEDPLRKKLRGLDFDSEDWKVRYLSFGTVDLKNTGSKLATDVHLEMPEKGEYILKSSDGEKTGTFDGQIPIGNVRPGGFITVKWWGGYSSSESLGREARVTFTEGPAKKVSFPDESSTFWPLWGCLIGLVNLWALIMVIGLVQTSSEKRGFNRGFNRGVTAYRDTHPKEPQEEPPLAEGDEAT